MKEKNTEKETVCGLSTLNASGALLWDSYNGTGSVCAIQTLP